MPIIPYCVLLSSAVLPEIVTGVQERPVQRLEHGDISALYSEIQQSAGAPGEAAQAGMAFQSVVQQAFGASVVIPFRFPTLLQDLAELSAHLAEKHDLYASALARLQGKAQMETRITPRMPVPSASSPSLQGSPAAPPASGTDYLKQKQAEGGRLRGLADEIRNAAASTVLDWCIRNVGDGLRCYALIRHDAAREFKQHLVNIKPDPTLQVIITGPWPPSEFVEQS